ncbi:MAG TPA: IS200/IS605 family transposase [Phycisphaerae bacterium]|nr:IS200/IS605 family transposase [Phycisphaerae bacterium]
MPRNVYHEINPHIVWRTKDSAPVLVNHVENRCHHYIRHRAIQTAGVFVHEIGGMPDHVHLVVSVPPTLLISEWVGQQLKGASSHHINHEICNRNVLAWQTGYGVVSFGTRDVPWVIDYVRRQREHHTEGRAFDRLERIERLDDETRAGEGDAR